MSREKILQAIKRNKPAVSPLPDLPVFAREQNALLPAFMAAVEMAGGKVHLQTKDETLDEIARQYYPLAERIICRIASCQLGNTDPAQLEKLIDLHGLDLAILPSRMGVAENAAVWLTEEEMGQRIVPFIAEHLILVLDRKDIVGDMHQAYRRMEIDETGFGLFIAGPSKTADIEQSLVIGAQGPRTWVVILV